MIHNNFTLVGYVLSNFVLESEDSLYRLYRFNLEVERLNGKTVEISINYLEDKGSQNKIDQTKIVGSQVAITGYILASASKSVKLVAQEIFLLDKTPFKKSPVLSETILVEDLFE